MLFVVPQNGQSTDQCSTTRLRVTGSRTASDIVDGQLGKIASTNHSYVPGSSEIEKRSLDVLPMTDGTPGTRRSQTLYDVAPGTVIQRSSSADPLTICGWPPAHA